MTKFSAGKVRGAAIKRGVERAEKAGYTVIFRDFVEDSRTPGMLGQIAGRTDRERKVIVIGTFKRSREFVAAILEHECEHAEGVEIAADRPEFGIQCGNKACSDAARRALEVKMRRAVEMLPQEPIRAGAKVVAFHRSRS